MDKEALNVIFEGIISLAVVTGAGLMVAGNPNNTAVVGLASGAGMAVIAFWFGQRGTTKAVNGNIEALGNIANQLNTSREQAATTAAESAVRVATATTQAATNAATQIAHAERMQP